MKKIFTLMLSMAMVAGAQAQTIAPKVAAQKAAGLFQKSSAAKGATANVVEPQLAYVSVLNGDTCFYVFNNPQGGFAIIGGDLAAREVLATVDNGSFDINNIPSNMKFMLGEYASQIANAKGSVTTETPNPTWTCGEDVAQIMQTKWDQDKPYNLECPYYNKAADKHCATGCVATAAAQAVFTVFKNANKSEIIGKNDKTYTHNVTTSDGKKTTAIQDYVASTPISLDMKTEYNAKEDTLGGDTQSANVAKFMMIMGTIAQMTYGNSSGTTSEALTRGLYNNLNLDAKFLNKKDKGMGDKEWEEFIYKELAAGRPVIFGADTKTGGGHEFVLDGYQKSNDNFHVNWGWGGSCDGWFALSGDIATANGHNNDDNNDKGTGSWMYPTSQGTGGSGTGETWSASAYRYGHEIVYNLVERAAGSKDMPEVDAGNAELSQESTQSSSAKGMATTDVANVVNIYVGDGTDATSGYKMHIGFGEQGAKAGNDAELIWGVELEPVDENDSICSILDASSGKGDAEDVFKVVAGSTISGYDIPVGEYSWSADGSNNTIKAGQYRVTPIMYYCGDADDTEFIDPDDIVYVVMPYGWEAPIVNFVLGSKPATSIKSVETSAQESAKVTKVIRKNRIVLEKDGKQFDAAGARLN